MKHTWRWFGPSDTARIDDIVQTGAMGVVTALHHVPDGEVWPAIEISKRQHQIAHRLDGTPSGLSWEVVESLPVRKTSRNKRRVAHPCR